MKIIEKYISKIFLKIIAKIFAFFFFIFALFTFISNGFGVGKEVFYELIDIPFDIYRLSELFLAIGIAFFTTHMVETNQLIPTLSVKYNLSKLLNLITTNSLLLGIFFVFILQPVNTKLHNMSRDFKIQKKHAQLVYVNVVCKKNLNTVINLTTNNKIKPNQAINFDVSIKIFENKQIALNHECKKVKLTDNLCEKLDLQTECGITAEEVKKIVFQEVDDKNEKKHNIYINFYHNISEFINEISMIFRFISIALFGFILNLNFSRKAGLDGLKFLYTVLFAIANNFISEMLYNYSSANLSKMIFIFFIPQILITVNVISFCKKKIH